MYALFCADPGLLRRVASAIPSGLETCVTDRWTVFERAAARASCAVIALRWLHDFFGLSTSALDTPAIERPLVLVTARDADNARLLKDIRADEVVWLQDVERELPRALRRAESRGLLERLARGFETSTHLPTLLRHGLAHACRADPAIGGVADLATLVGRDRRTLWRLWHLTPGPSLGWRLEDLLGWLLLVRALSLKHPACAWVAVARQLGVHEQTLARLSRRLIGLPLSSLADRGEDAIARQFVEAIAGPLLADGTICRPMRRSALALEAETSLA
jgi:hypothetical protein